MKKDRIYALILAVVTDILLFYLLTLMIPDHHGRRPLKELPPRRLVFLRTSSSGDKKPQQAVVKEGHVSVPLPSEFFKEKEGSSEEIPDGGTSIVFRHFSQRITDDKAYSMNDPVQREMGEFIKKTVKEGPKEEPGSGSGGAYGGVAVSFSWEQLFASVYYAAAGKPWKAYDNYRIFDISVKAYKSGDLKTACEMASYVAADTPDPELREKAFYRRLMCLFSLGENEELVKEGNAFLGMFPNSSFREGVSAFLVLAGRADE